MPSFWRVALITVGLMVVGSVVGAACGTVGLGLGLALQGAWRELGPDVVSIGATFGAPVGALTTPLISWGLLRRVPLGRAILWSAVGTTVGGALGWTGLVGSGDAVTTPILSALAGFLTAAVLLRRTYATARVDGAGDHTLSGGHSTGPTVIPAADGWFRTFGATDRVGVRVASGRDGGAP